MIRPATAADAAAIAAIWNHVIRETVATFNSTEKPVAEVAALITSRPKAGHCFLVAESAAGVVGFVTYDQFRGGSGYRLTMEHTIQLAPEAAGHGLGRALMAAMEDHARQAGVHVMMAGVAGENTAGKAFHAALGYQLVGSLPQVGYKFGRYMDLWLMQKILS
ncbi:GNAT family N-acetyltransferase [Pseudotabrizicola sp. L79]|uniref:GNAT family N-acetyltransferase n=1 Tax=Pseudotabrizicola sp. L79 TaxID=3118402 RepID=UPI002F93B3DB